jgi:environmental stress-induced protein Ves
MALLELIPRAAQRDEPWANGAGTTTVILREPDSAAWQIRVSVARVEAEGPFSELPATRRTLVPLDAPMTLRFPAGNALHARRFGILCFDSAPAPTGLLPEGPTRDFNLMLRANAHGEALPRTLLDSMILPLEPDTRWLVYLDSGHATLSAGDAAPAHLNQGDAALVAAGADTSRVILEGAGEIVLVKLYA